MAGATSLGTYSRKKTRPFGKINQKGKKQLVISK
tara:strand:- start:683 stop:784 length:102 start_codon:yes stop_codon:yes gene_type:complete